LVLHAVKLADQVQDGMGRAAFGLLAGRLLNFDELAPDMGQAAEIPKIPMPIQRDVLPSTVP
jgi:hypothetical protein